jgi:hypothetical protein
MSEAKHASLTVLGGPLGGSRVELPDDGEITIGSGEDCTFRLDTAGVNPLHARVVLEGGQATVFSTGADRPLHINDNPLGGESAALRNGDILWLGVPGEDDVAMLQCILAARPAAAPAPAPTVAEPTPDIETQALFIASEEPGPPLEEEAAAAASPVPSATGKPADDEPYLMDFDAPLDEEGVVVGEPEVMSDEELAPVDLGEGGDAVVVDEDELFTDATPTFVEGSEAAPAEEEVLSAEPLPAPEAPTPVEVPPTPVEPIPEPPAAETPAPRAEPPAPAPPTPPARSPERPPDRSAPAHAAPRAPLPRRRPTSPRPEAPEVEETEGRSPMLLALVGFVGVLAVAILGWGVWRFVLAKPSPAPTPVAAATATPPPVSTAPPPATPPPAEVPTPEPTATPMETAPPEPTPPPPQAAAPEPTPTPKPTPTPTPPPAAAPAPPSGPSAEEQRAQQNAARVEELLGQADAAVAARQYAAAIGQLDEALGLDPGNSRATATRARAVALRDLANRRFVSGRTRVQTEKAQGGGLAGFDAGDADVRKAPDFQGRIEFEMSPPGGIAAGDPWTLRIFVINEGEKDIKIRGVDAVTEVNGSGGGGAVAARTSEVPTQRRLLVGELSGTWVEGTESWSTQVTVTANRGDSLRASVTWR